MDLADRLLEEMTAEVAYLESLSSPLPDAATHPAFHH
jgi:hypothetical protein